ncbi:MAG: alanine--glyoxylate aminotransferase family protein [Dehalococcoidia bacterium]
MSSAFPVGVRPVNLRIPGPTPCPDDVLAAMGRQMINHRGPEFAEIITRVTEGLQQLFQTEYDVLILTASGTGAMEALIVNHLSPGDRVLNVSIGSFGDRFATIAETYGANVERLAFEWGTAADPGQVASALEKDDYKAVLVTHNETSTGVTNDLEAIAAACRRAKPDVLILVDAISSLGSLSCAVDAWDLDAVATGSQKGWMVPPGLAFISMRPRAWEAWEQAKMPRFYFDLGRARDMLTKGQTPWTPAVSIFYALDVALKRLTADGLERIVARHHRFGELTRAGVRSLGLQLFADERHASDTVTAVRVPDGVDGPKLNKMMREEYKIVLAGGQGKLAGQIFRIGHLGWATEGELTATIDALRDALPKLGYKLPEGATAG